MISISVVIPTLNAGSQIEQLIKSLLTQSLSPEEIVVIDSGSRDGTPEIASRLGARVLRIPRWLFNHGQTRNYAISRCKGNLVVLTVQDALPCDDTWLEKLCLPLLHNESLVATSGKQVVPIDAPPLARLKGHLWEQSLDSHFAIKSVDSPASFWSVTPEERLQLVTFDNVTSCVRKSAWSLQPFPRISFGEDIAWATKALLRGWQIAWVPEATVWHYHDRSMAYEFKRAFLNGCLKASVLRWSGMQILPREAIEIYKEIRKQTFFERLQYLENTYEIKESLYSEILNLNRNGNLTGRLYEKTLQFSWALINAWEELYETAVIPADIWQQILHYSKVAVFGEELGLSAAQQHGIFWKLLRLLVGRRV